MNDSIRIGAFEAKTGAGNEGFTVESQGLDGLFKGVGIKSNTVPRPTNHGDFDVPVYRTARFVTVGGLCFAANEAELDDYNRQLTGLLADGSAGDVVFDVHSTRLTGVAKINDEPQFEPIVWGSIARWQLLLKFNDPRLYGETFRAGPGASVVLRQFGNFAAPPIYSVTGSAPTGYTIAGPGGRLYTVTKPLVAGHPHTIDMATGYLTVDGAIQYGVVTAAQLWAVPASVAVTATVTPVSGTATISGKVRKTVI